MEGVSGEQGVVGQNVGDGDGMGKESVDAKVRMCLERVDISRALDFIGVVEVVGEVGRICEDAEGRMEKVGAEMGTAAVAVREEIVDSEEEDEALEDLDEGSESIKQQGGSFNDRGTSVIVIDNITNVVGNLFNSSELTSCMYNFLSLPASHN